MWIFFVLLRLFFKHIIKLTIKVSETIQNFLTNFKKDSSKEVELLYNKDQTLFLYNMLYSRGNLYTFFYRATLLISQVSI